MLVMLPGTWEQVLRTLFDFWGRLTNHVTISLPLARNEADCIGISPLDERPEPHRAQEKTLDVSESRRTNPQVYADQIQSTDIRTGVNKTMTRFGLIS